MPVSSPHIQHPAIRPSHEEIREEVVEAAELAPGLALRAVELGVVALVALLVCPPLAILAVVVVVPLLAVGIAVGLIAVIVGTPYLLVRHVREHHRAHRSSAFAHELRRLQARRA